MRMGHFSFFWSSGSVSTSSRLEYRLPWEKPAVTVDRAACNLDCRTRLTHFTGPCAFHGVASRERTLAFDRADRAWNDCVALVGFGLLRVVILWPGSRMTGPSVHSACTHHRRNHMILPYTMTMQRKPEMLGNSSSRILLSETHPGRGCCPQRSVRAAQTPGRRSRSQAARTPQAAHRGALQQRPGNWPEPRSQTALLP